MGELFVDDHVGRLTEPLTGRSWDADAVRDQCRRRMVRYADLGLARFDRVFLHHGNTLEFFADLLAIWRLGCCAIPIDSRLTPFEVETLARAAAPRVSLWGGNPDPASAACLTSLGILVLDALEVGERVRPPALRSAPGDRALPDDDALVLFTSGTTGEPKGVVHTHRTLRARWSSLGECLGIDAFQRTLCLLPTHFGHGLICNCLFPWLSGQDLFILPPFRSDVVSRLGTIVDDFAITAMSSVPAVWRLALRTARPPRTPLRRVLCGSAPLSASMWNSIGAWAGTRDVLNAYGITETGSWLAGTTVPDFAPEDGMIGVAWGGELRILPSGSTDASPARTKACAPGETGHVWIRTPALMRGYLGREDRTRQVVADGWFSTGDLGFLDGRGVLYLRGREREEINKGGMKIHPGDVDAVAERFSAEVDVCTFGYEDPFHGQDVGIALALRAGDEATLRALRSWMERHLARHQMPQRWYVIDAIPRNARGKVNRASVAAMCASLTPLGIDKPGPAGLDTSSP